MSNVSDLLRIYGDFKSAGKLGRNFADKHRRPVSQSIIRVPSQPVRCRTRKNSNVRNVNL